MNLFSASSLFIVEGVMLHSSITEQKSRTQTFHSVTDLGWIRGYQAGTAYKPVTRNGDFTLPKEKGNFVLHDH